MSLTILNEYLSIIWSPFSLFSFLQVLISLIKLIF